MSGPRVLTAPLGGSALARGAMAGTLPAGWYPAPPRSPAAWQARARAVAGAAPASWHRDLSLAFAATGAARDRLARVAAAGGVLVTTGQQPGLFGGPVYTWSKAVAALELADAIERVTGIPTAPVFWAATDDGDFAEASSTWVATADGAERLALPGPALEGLPMQEHPLGDVSDLIDRLAAACGSTVDPGILDVVRLAYHPGATIGGAYLTLLRLLLEPLGIAVLDASHHALMAAERPSLVQALRQGPALAEALADRRRALEGAGHAPQVADVEGLSLVFTREHGRKVRVPLAQAPAVADRAARERLSPNVLLRPVVEAAVLPTVAYVAGPGELAYFAQVSAVAQALGARAPLAVPRWSCTILEPAIAELLAQHGMEPDALADVAAVEARLVRARGPMGPFDRLARLRAQVASELDGLRAECDGAGGLLPGSSVDGTARQLTHRLDRLERRLVAGLKRRDADARRTVGRLAGALYPGGMRQERALNLLPLLARHGPACWTAMREGARAHADALVSGDGSPTGT